MPAHGPGEPFFVTFATKSVIACFDELPFHKGRVGGLSNDRTRAECQQDDEGSVKKLYYSYLCCLQSTDRILGRSGTYGFIHRKDINGHRGEHQTDDRPCAPIFMPGRFGCGTMLVLSGVFVLFLSHKTCCLFYLQISPRLPTFVWRFTPANAAKTP